MNITYHFEPTIPYSLHDMRVNQIERVGNHLRFYFETGYIELKDNFQQVDGNLLIEDVDMNFSDVHFLSENGAYGRFSGERMELEDFLKNYNDFFFEILDESYGYNTVFYQGYLSLPKKNNLIDMTMSIYYTGNIVYELKE